MLQGMRQVQRNLPHARRAITLADLHQCRREALPTTRLAFTDRQILWTAITVGFFGHLRVSEYTTRSTAEHNASRTLTRARVCLDQDSATLHLPISKTVKVGQGADVVLGATGEAICPVSALTAYLANTSGYEPDGLLFRFADGQPLTANDINPWLKAFLDPDVISHSLRIGGATRLAETGAADWQLHISGRCRSEAYQRYLRPSSRARATWTSKMSRHTYT